MKKLSKLTQSIRHLFTMLCGAILFFICPRLMLNHQKKWAPFVQWDYAHRGLHDNLWGVPENSLPAFQAAMDKGYGIDELANLAFYKAIDDFFGANKGIGQKDVENIIDNAISKSGRLGRKVKGIFESKTDGDGLKILQESDFNI